MERLSLQDRGISGALERVAGLQMEGALYVARNSLNGGELSPGMAARYDQPRAQCGCEYLLNMVPLPCGGLTKRPGFAHVRQAAAVEPGLAARLVPFIFSMGESRMLEFYGTGGGVGMRAHTPEGGMVDSGLVLPWRPEWLADMSFCQSADVVFVAHREMAPAKIMRYGDADWRYATINWLPEIAAPVIAEARATGTAYGEHTLTSYAYVATAISAENGEESVASGQVVVENTVPLSSTWYVRIVLQQREDVAEYRIYKKSAGVFGYIGRVAEADANGEWIFEDRNQQADTADTPPDARNPFAGAGQYPGIVFLHQQRLGYAASLNRPLTVWMSQAGNYESMAASIPPDDDDAIEATLAAPQANRILWALSDRNGLALGTEGGEWLLIASDGAAISPKDLSFQPQTYHGSQPGLDVLRAGSSLLFMQRGGRVIRDLGYSLQDDRYNSTDMSLLARHILAKNPCRRWCWQPEPHGIVWCALADGTLAGLTCLREHDVVGWHRHETDGQVEDVAAIPASDGSWLVYALTLRTHEGKTTRRLERLNPFPETFSPQDNPAPHLDGLEQLPFKARCVPCMPETNLQTGATFARIRKINAVKLRVINTAPFQARVTGQTPNPATIVKVPPRGGTPAATPLDWDCPVAGGWRDNARLELILDGPGPATILGLLMTIEIAPQAGGQM